MGSRKLLDPLAAPGWGVEGVSEVLGLMHDLTLAELHDAHGVRGLALVGDDVLRHPEIACADHAPDVEA